jgi:hypothetical protein
MQLHSTYKRDYDEKQGQPGQQGPLASKDKVLVSSKAGLDGTTTHRTDFIPRKVRV